MQNESERKHDAISALRDLVMVQLAESMPNFDSIPVCEFPEHEQEHLIIESGGKAVLITFEEASSEALEAMVKRQAVKMNVPLPAFMN